MNITIDIPCCDTASSRISERSERTVINAVELALHDIEVSLCIRINYPENPTEPIIFEKLSDPPEDCFIDPWEPWPEYYAADRNDNEEI